MPSISSSFRDLAVSVFEVIFSVCETAFNFIISIPEMARHIVKGLSEIFGGVGRFVTGNIVAIAIIAGGIYGYLIYQRRQWHPTQNGVEKSS